MSNWTKEAKKVAAGKWIKFDSANPSHVLVFYAEPTKVTKISQMGPSKGEEYTQMSFPVLLEGEEKILEPNRSLLTQLIEEDEESPIIGAELLIKCLNPEKKTQWKIRRISGEGSGIESYSKPKPAAREEEPEEEPEPVKEVQADKDKEKFMEGVKKTKAKKEKKVKKEAELEVETDAEGSTKEAD